MPRSALRGNVSFRPLATEAGNDVVGIARPQPGDHHRGSIPRHHSAAAAEEASQRSGPGGGRAGQGRNKAATSRPQECLSPCVPSSRAASELRSGITGATVLKIARNCGSAAIAVEIPGCEQRPRTQTSSPQQRLRCDSPTENGRGAVLLLGVRSALVSTAAPTVSHREISRATPVASIALREHSLSRVPGVLQSACWRARRLRRSSVRRLHPRHSAPPEVSRLAPDPADPEA